MGKHYNLKKVHEIAGSDMGFVNIIVETFLQEIPSDLESMKNAIENSNHKMAYQFAHKMKPNLEMFGIDLLSQIKAMEKWSDTNKPATAIQEQLDQITSTLTTVISELQEDF